MAINPIQNGELGSSVRSKLNQAIQEANKVSGKQDSSALGSAAFESVDAFDPVGSAQEAEDFAVQRENHTGEQPIETVSDLRDELDKRVIYVDTIADLQALDTSGLVAGQAASVQGSEFRWDGSEWIPLGFVKASSFGVTLENWQDKLKEFIEEYRFTEIDVDFDLSESSIVDIYPKENSEIRFTNTISETSLWPDDDRQQLLTFHDMKDSKVEGLTFVGIEDLNSWDYVSRRKICFEDCENTLVTRACFKGSSSGIRFVNCKFSGIENSFFEWDLFERTTPDGSNLDRKSSALVFVSGQDNFASLCTANGFGNGVVQTLVGQRLSVTGCKFRDVVDNGVYISSGDSCVVSGCQIENHFGGVKMRGKNNQCIGNNFRDGTGDIQMTGQGTPNSDGYNGWGIVVKGNTSVNTRGIFCRFDAFPDGNEVDGFITNSVFTGNCVYGAEGLGNAVVRLDRCDGVTVSNNTFSDIDGGYDPSVILVEGRVGRVSQGCVVSGNSINNAQIEGIRLTNTNRAVVSSNTIFGQPTQTYQIEIRLSDFALISSNTVERRIRLNSNFANNDCFITGNISSGSRIYGDDEANNEITNNYQTPE